MSGAALLLVIVLVAGGLMLVPLWTSALADLLWMFTLRGWLVGGITLAIFFAIVLMGHVLCGLAAGSASLVALGMLATPGLARAAADWIAYCRSGPDRDRIAPHWRGFVFAAARRQKNDAYEAPPTGQ